MTHRERVARDLARKSGVRLDDYPFGSSPNYVSVELDALRKVEDPALRQQAWELLWLLRASSVEHGYKFSGDQEELERRFP